MPSPFTSSFASAAAGNSANEGNGRGRGDGSADWWVHRRDAPLLIPLAIARVAVLTLKDD